MSGNTFGTLLRLTTFGESHGVGVGGVLDGVPPNIQLDLIKIQEDVDKRRPGQNPFVSSRKEEDKVEILSGVFEGKTLGTPLAFFIWNKDQKSADYDSLKDIFRPGHGDYAYFKKYTHMDPRGGGRASARETVSRVVAGSIASQILLNLFSITRPRIQSAVIQVGSIPINKSRWNDDFIETNPFFCPDPDILPIWEEYILKKKEKGSSVGALIEVRASGVPEGLGEPVFDKLNADIAKALMSINAVKGVEIGDGFNCINDETFYDEMRMNDKDDKPLFLSNKAGGILAGISTGVTIICRIAVKPTSSTKAPRETITKKGENVTVSISGRHDPCVGIRAAPIAKAMVSLTLADHALRFRGQCGKPMQ